MDKVYYFRYYSYGYSENPVLVQRGRQREWLNSIAKTRHRRRK
jgi:hypothetical protein